MRVSQLGSFRFATLAGAAVCAVGLCLPQLAQAESADYDSEQGTPLADRVLGTGQWFWLQGKAMPGFEFAMGRGLFEADVELSFIGLTEPSRQLEGGFAGNQLGVYLMLTPLRDRYYDVSAGLGGDVYLLWGIHPDAREAAFAPRLVARIWPLEDLALTVTARTYLLHSDGLALGTARDGTSGPQFLVSTGVTWRFF